MELSKTKFKTLSSKFHSFANSAGKMTLDNFADF